MWWFYRVLVASLLLGLLSSFRLNVPKFASKGSLRSLKSTPADEQTTDTVAKDVHPPTTGKSFPTPIEKILDEGAEPEKKEIEKFLMLYTCKMCSFRNSNMVSKVGFYSGMVVSTCKGCQNMHLIADNERKLDFGDDGFARADEYLISKGEKVRELSLSMSKLRDNYLVEKDGVLTLVPKTLDKAPDGAVVQLPKALQDKLGQ